MTTKMESKQRTPSVIARLMGLDELPPQQPVLKQRRVLSENYLHRVASIGAWEKRLSPERRSFRFSVEEQEEFKDVFAVQETLTREKHQYASVEKRKSNMKSSELQMAFMSQKVRDVDPISMDLGPRTLKEAYDAPSVDSRKELFQNYLQKPSSLIPKHLHDLQGLSPHMNSRSITVLKSSGSSECGRTDTFRKSKRRIHHGNAKLPQKPKNSHLTGSRGDDSTDIVYKFLRYPKESKNEACLLNRKIVVLKPNPGKTEHTSRCSSPSSHEAPHLGDRKHKAFLCLENQSLFAELKEKKQLADEAELLRQLDKVSGEMVEDFPRQTRHGISDISSKASRSRFRDADSLGRESKAMMVSSPKFFDLRFRYKSLLYPSDESYVAREAKKQISERWKSTKMSREAGLGSESRCKNRTLGEMLAMPDSDMRPRYLDYKLGEDGMSNYICTADRHENSASSLCISSRDGWKGACVRDLPTSKLPPMYSSSIMNPKTRSSQRAVESLESIFLAQHKSGELDLGQQVGPELKNVAVSCRKSLSLPQEVSLHNHSIEDNHIIKIGPEDKLAEKDPPMQNSAISMSSSQQDILLGISDEGSVSSHCSGTDPESIGTLEEAYQPSPVSVLEPPFQDEISTDSECIPTINLHGVKWQLDIPKSESFEAYSEGTGMVVSSDDEDAEDRCRGNSEGKEDEDLIQLFKVEESRDFSYMVDVLTEAGFHGRSKGFDTWLSSEWPINPVIFEKLEKKYGEQASWKRSERKLLFDRVNSGLIELLQPCLGVSTWEKPVSRRLSIRQQGPEVIDELWTLLISQEEQAKQNSSANVLGKDDRWLALGDDIEIIGIEIENWLIDELVSEIVRIESF